MTPGMGVDMIEEFDVEKELVKRDVMLSSEHLHASDSEQLLLDDDVEYYIVSFENNPMFTWGRDTQQFCSIDDALSCESWKDP